MAVILQRSKVSRGYCDYCPIGGTDEHRTTIAVHNNENKFKTNKLWFCEDCLRELVRQVNVFILEGK